MSIFKQPFSKSPNNEGRYVNPEIDQLILAANQQFNDTLRLREYRYAAKLAIADQTVILLFFTKLLWIIRPDVVFRPVRERPTLFSLLIRTVVTSISES